MIVGMAGHVDHGKTTLVKALTGVDTDRLKEERARGITIDLGFAYMAGQGGEVIGFVDVPGHERFVRTMVAGAAGIDFALVVVAADEGVMPQTREHLAILGLLGVAHGVIVITKCDRVDRQRQHAAAKAASTAATPVLAAAPVLFVSARAGLGLDVLRGHIEAAAAECPGRDRGGVFRMAVDRSFSLTGVGTVVTGMASAGRVGVGDAVTVMPGWRTARVRSLHAQNRAVMVAAAGERCALALSGPGIGAATIDRGDWVCAEPVPLETRCLDGAISLLAGEARPRADGMPVHFHCGASDELGRVTMLSGEGLGTAVEGFARITLDRPLPLRHGDRFVLRDQSARRTIGGGVVVDIAPPPRQRRGADRFARLAAMSPRDPAVALAACLDLEPGFEDLAAFGAHRGLSRGDTGALCASLGLTALRGDGGGYACRPTDLRGTEDRLVSTLQAFHAANPGQRGIAGEEVRRAALPTLSRRLFGSVLQSMLADRRVVLDGHRLRLPDHVARVDEAEARLAAAACVLIGRSRYQPPRVRDMSKLLDVEEAVLRGACRTFARLGDLVEIGPDRFFLHAAVTEMADAARGLVIEAESERFHATAFRDRLGIGRKLAIEVLDHFDRRGVTRREGEWRRMVDAPTRREQVMSV